MVQQYSDVRSKGLHRLTELLQKMSAQAQKWNLKSSAMKTGEQNFLDSDRKGFSLPLQKRIMGKQGKGRQEHASNVYSFVDQKIMINNVTLAGLPEICIFFVSI